MRVEFRLDASTRSPGLAFCRDLNFSMLEIYAHIYDYPKYYDLIFAAEWKPEFEFLESVFQKHGRRKVRSLFEPACGTGRLLYRFAKAGYIVAGNDLNSKAVAFCNQRLSRHGIEPTAQVGDMTDFVLHKRVDAAFNTINSFRHLQSDRLAIAHLKCMAAAISPGGVYVVGFHLSPAVSDEGEEECWLACRGSLTVDSRMWFLERNHRKRFETYGMSFCVKTPKRQFRIVDEVKFRTYNVAQIRRLLAQVPEFSLTAIYDFNYNSESTIELNGATEDAIFVLTVR